MTKEQFDKLYVGDNTVVNCPTDETRKEFLKLADSFGYLWITGKRYTEFEPYTVGIGLCFSLARGQWEYKSYYASVGYTVVEYKLYPLKQKSLYEQALGLLNLKVGDEFEVNMFTKGSHWVVFKVLEDRFESLCDFGSLYYHVDLDSLLKNPSSIRNIVTPKVKSEAELVLDELKVAMDKANEILRKVGD